MEIEKILEHYNIEIDSNVAADELLCYCPFHTEGATPNLTVNIIKDVFYCFSCGKGGNHITFVQEMEKLDSYEDAVKLMKHLLYGNYNVELLKSKFERLGDKSGVQKEYVFSVIKQSVKRKIDDKLIELYNIVIDKKYHELKMWANVFSKRFGNSSFYFLIYNNEYEDKLFYIDYSVGRLDSLFYRCINEKLLFSYYAYFLKEVQCLEQLK